MGEGKFMRRPIARAAHGQSSKSGVFARASTFGDAAFTSDLRDAREQVSALRMRIVEAAGAPNEDDRTLQQLDFASEELLVVEAELHAQADEILATRDSLDRERRRYRELFELAPEAHLVTDLRGNVLEANRRAGVLLNLDSKLIVGKPLIAFVGLADRERFQQMLVDALDRSLHGALRLQPRRSDPLGVSFSARRCTSAAGPGMGIQWLLQPSLGPMRAAQQRASRQRITELERERAELDASLKKAEAEKAALLARLEQKDHALSEIAHELGIPLGSIAGWLRMLVQDKLPHELRRRGLMSMTRGVRALVHMVEELSDHAQLEQRTVAIQHEPINLLRVVMEIVEDLRPIAQLKATSMEIVAAPQALEVNGDVASLQKVFRNLIGTAINVSPEHGTIHIATSGSDGQALIAVSDSGAAMPSERLPELFQPFAPTARSADEGLGLGLSIAQRLVRLHGGSLEARSDGPDYGLTIIARLPLVERE
jgi:signal transduction histidine kinase